MLSSLSVIPQIYKLECIKRCGIIHFKLVILQNLSLPIPLLTYKIYIIFLEKCVTYKKYLSLQIPIINSTRLGIFTLTPFLQIHISIQFCIICIILWENERVPFALEWECSTEVEMWSHYENPNKIPIL